MSEKNRHVFRRIIRNERSSTKIIIDPSAPSSHSAHDHVLYSLDLLPPLYTLDNWKMLRCILNSFRTYIFNGTFYFIFCNSNFHVIQLWIWRILSHIQIRIELSRICFQSCRKAALHGFFAFCKIPKCY